MGFKGAREKGSEIWCPRVMRELRERRGGPYRIALALEIEIEIAIGIG